MYGGHVSRQVKGLLVGAQELLWRPLVVSGGHHVDGEVLYLEYGTAL